jgi:ABC-type uncharacterized transport system substrate-binding protein
MPIDTPFSMNDLNLGYEVITMEIRRAEDIGPAFETLRDRADAIYIVIDALVVTSRASINAS